MADSISLLSREEGVEALPQLIDLLCDVVESGASIGFLPPLSAEEAAHYWRTVIAGVERETVLLWAARRDNHIVGSVQLQPSPKANGSHRAEVAKLMVHMAHRRQGIGRALMEALEAEALQRGRTTLVLDTRQGDPSERLYRRMGWTRSGVIPRYARSADGALHPTVYYFKLLEGRG